jgi:hypothetical protein
MSWENFWTKLISFILDFLKPKNKNGVELKQTISNQKKKSLIDIQIGGKREINIINNYGQSPEKIPPTETGETSITGTVFKK